MEEKIFEMRIEDELIDGVFAISLVESPAIELDYVMLSKENKVRIDLASVKKIVDKKRQIVSGPALIPDKVIPRKGYSIVFSKDTIRKISENYLINGKKDNVTLEHNLTVNKIKMVESWVIDDENHDKAVKLGYEKLPVGTWMVSLKITDEYLWKEYIEKGVLKGFSIEGSFSQKDYKLEEEIEEEYIELAKLFLYEKKNINDIYQWKLGGADENCPACIKFDRQQKTLKAWSKIALPKFRDGDPIGTTGLSYVSPHGSGKYGTYCEQHCKCRLVKVRSAPKVKSTPGVADFINRYIVNPFKRG